MEKCLKFSEDVFSFEGHEEHVDEEEESDPADTVSYITFDFYENKDLFENIS